MLSPQKVDRARRRTAWLVAAACAVVGVALLLFLVLLPMRGYAVTKTLRVKVRVADQDTHQGVANVVVMVVRGQEIRYDTRITQPLMEDAERERFVTGESGDVEFQWPFEAIVGENAFGTVGAFVNNTWIQIAAPGYGEVLLPLDGQAARRRDFGDEEPIVVTVVLKQPKCD